MQAVLQIGEPHGAPPGRHVRAVHSTIGPRGAVHTKPLVVRIQPLELVLLERHHTQPLARVRDRERAPALREEHTQCRATAGLPHVPWHVADGDGEASRPIAEGFEVRLEPAQGHMLADPVRDDGEVARRMLRTLHEHDGPGFAAALRTAPNGSRVGGVQGSSDAGGHCSVPTAHLQLRRIERQLPIRGQHISLDLNTGCGCRGRRASQCALSGIDRRCNGVPAKATQGGPSTDVRRRERAGERDDGAAASRST